MEELIVRTAAPSELERVRSTYRAWGYDGGAAEADVVLVAERDGRITGLVRRTFEHDTVMLRGMQVEPSARRSGVGTRLLRTFVADLRDRGCFCVPYAHLVGFYRRGGFEVHRADAAPEFLKQRLDRYRKEGLDVLLMRRAEQ